jgi:hypothetical protein
MPADGFGDNCTRDAQMRAEWAWRNAQLTSLSSIAGMRNALAALSRVPGDKTVILISGGWPLDDREEQFLITQVASDAAAARATIFSLFVPDAPFEAARRTPSPTVVDDLQIQSQPLEHLASLTGGGTFRAYVGAEEAFGRMAREASAYYRIGVEKTVYDNDGRDRRMKVRVSRDGVTVRARDLFDTRTYEDRDWTARLASALEAPVVATGIGLRVTSYITADPGDPARLQVVLAGEASRVGAGDATFRLLVQDLEGRKVISGDQPIGEPTDEGLTFSTRVPLPPGRYIARLAVIDGEGRTGSVEHLLDVRQDSLGDIGVTGPVLVRVPAGAQRNPRLALADTRQDERLAMQVHLNGDENRLSNTEVVFEVAASADGRALIETGADISPGPRSGWVVAQGIADLRVLPPGPYVARARIAADGKPLGEVRRDFVVSGGRSGAPAAVRVSAPTAGPRTSEPRRLASVPAPAVRFTLDTALAPAVLDPFLERVAARPDAGTQDVRELLARARASGVAGLLVPDTLVSGQPVAAFLKGLAQLADHQVDPAATTFRAALRAAPDLYPAMVYLGVCYAAVGRDKEAAAAWRTSLIKEGDTRVLHVLLADALLRQQQGESALRVVDAARARWPADQELKRRFVTAALLAGRYDEGFEALDELVQANAEDESTLLAGLLVLYESIDAGTPVQGPDDDRARMARLADAYRERGGTSVALVDTWLAAARKP